MTPRESVTRTAEGRYQTRHAIHEDGLSVTLAKALAEVSELSLPHLIETLNDYFDPSALDRLFRVSQEGTQRAGDGRVVLDIEGHRVRVHNDGVIEIELRGGSGRDQRTG